MSLEGRSKGFNSAALKVIDFLGGDTVTGKCFCPVHEDGRKPSLAVSNGDKRPVVLHCFGGKSREHDLQVINHLRANGVWPAGPRPEDHVVHEQRPPEERRRYALGVWNQLRRQRGRETLLASYLAARGLSAVPETAAVVLPAGMVLATVENPDPIAAHNPGMVFPVRSSDAKFQGIHVVWLDGNMTAKREEEPQRQSYGLVKGHFIELQS